MRGVVDPGFVLAAVFLAAQGAISAWLSIAIYFVEVHPIANLSKILLI